ncbi:MAG: SUMF1/EgtB/PvdO family nonheme iron enzyme, partial [Chloroflexi bacterium]|nr:SUMF1/EgtB/PvdO family nonheme iron enzyme [Chloroflexota bacterium]
LDAAGNVWEWTLSKWADTYQHPEDNDIQGESSRVLRGGAWHRGQDDVRCASRCYGFPRDGLDGEGFRVAGWSLF